MEQAQAAMQAAHAAHADAHGPTAIVCDACVRVLLPWEWVESECDCELSRVCVPVAIRVCVREGESRVHTTLQGYLSTSIYHVTPGSGTPD